MTYTTTININGNKYKQADYGRFEAALIDNGEVIAVTRGNEVVMYRGILEDVQEWAEMCDCDRVECDFGGGR